jgi:D-lactate dehydrogenase
VERTPGEADAWHFRVVREAVVVASDTGHVSAPLRGWVRVAVPVTFRSGGTGLSEQGVSSGLLVETRCHFRKVR